MDDHDEERIRRAVRRGIHDAEGGSGCGCLIMILMMIYLMYIETH
ncbi:MULTISPECIES: hypothetical protein [unclassified Streptomyces]|jgi:hypothetical protein|nr:MULTISPECIES: hypothetical protein [unclassified Streptomyces]